MTDLPAKDAHVTVFSTNIQGKQAYDDSNDFAREQPGGSAEKEITIASGIITPQPQDSRAIVLRTEASATTDVLDRVVLDNIPEGAEVELRSSLQAERPFLTHNDGGVGEMLFGSGVGLDLTDPAIRVRFRRVGNSLREIWTRKPKVAFLARVSGTSQDNPLVTGSVVELASEIFDIGGYFDPSASQWRFTPKIGGIYRVSGSAQWENPVISTDYSIQLVKNSITTVATALHNARATNERFMTLTSTLVEMDGVDDFLQMIAFGDSIADLEADTVATFMAGELVV